MRIEIWSDIACPWCYLGKRRLETALEGFAHRDEVEVVWRSYQLDPGSPTEPVETVASYLGRKYGGGEAAGRRMVDRVEAVAAEEGMVWSHHRSQRVSTLDAHRLVHLAFAEGGPELQGAVKEALFAAYFTRGANIADHAVLRDLATEAGLDVTRVDEVLSGAEFRDAVFADQERAAAHGASGVPFYVVAERYGVSGAQPAELFGELLEKAWSETRPAVQLVPSDAEVCGPDGCAP